MLYIGCQHEISEDRCKNTISQISIGDKIPIVVHFFSLNNMYC